MQLSVGLKLALLKLLKIQTKYINPEINTKIFKFLLDLQCISPKYSEHSSVVFIFFNIWSCGFKIQTKLSQNGLTFPTFDVLNISNVCLFKYFTLKFSQNEMLKLFSALAYDLGGILTIYNLIYTFWELIFIFFILRLGFQFLFHRFGFF